MPRKITISKACGNTLWIQVTPTVDSQTKKWRLWLICLQENLCHINCNSLQWPIGLHSQTAVDMCQRVNSPNGKLTQPWLKILRLQFSMYSKLLMMFAKIVASTLNLPEARSCWRRLTAHSKGAQLVSWGVLNTRNNNSIWIAVICIFPTA